MPRVHVEAGCSFFIYTDDHLPRHVHVKVSDGVVIILLDTLEVSDTLGKVKANDIRKALRIAEANQGKLLEAWRKIHG